MLALALYVRTAAPGMIYAGGVSVDSAEIQRTAYHLGIIHSTGYPLYTVLAFLVARLGAALGQSPYTWITYFSAVCGALSLVVLFRAARLIAKLLPALAVALLLMVTNSIWFMSTIAEVQGLQALILAGLLWALVYYHQHPTQHQAMYLAALCVGLGLANHRLIVLALPAVAFTLLVHHRQWGLRQWGMLALCALLPLLSYAYIYLRAADPFVVYSARPLWIPQPISIEDTNNLIRGTFAGSGRSLNTNFEVDLPPILSRVDLVMARFGQDWHPLLMLAAVVGVAALLFINGRIGVTLALCAAPVIPFMLVWKVDIKPILYQFTLWFPLALGLAALASLEMPRPKDVPQSDDDPNHPHAPKYIGTAKAQNTQRAYFQGRAREALPIMGSILMVLAAAHQFNVNLPLRDQSQDRRAEDFSQAMSALPQNALFVSVQWAPDIFIALDTLERSGRQDVIVMNTDDWWAILDRIYNPEFTVYVGEFWRSRVGLYDGAIWLQ